MVLKKVNLLITAVITTTLLIGIIPEKIYAKANELHNSKHSVTTSTSVYFNEDESKLTFFDLEEENNSELFLIDADNTETLPQNYRSTKQDLSEKNKKNIDLTGLSNLNMSGSGALSTKGLEMIKKQTNNYNLIDIDLRKESHGVIDGYAVSWYGENNDANNGLTENEIIADEMIKFAFIRMNGYVKFDYDKNKSASNLLELDDIQEAETEGDMAEAEDVRYLRIMVADPLKPSDEAVDKFVRMAKIFSNNKNTWLHFHCRNGVGRTTAFMCMYDMMNNAKQVSYNDILKRQALIGGFDYLSAAESQHARLEFLESFYEYCKNNTNNFETSYSEYIESK